MKTEQFSDALHLLNDDIIEETDRIRNKKKSGIKGWQQRAVGAACAACAAAAVCGGVWMFLRQETDHSADVPGHSSDSFGILASQPENGEGIPAPSVSEEPCEDTEGLPMLFVWDGRSEGRGFEGFRGYDISELVNENPWNEAMELSTLPVYKNPLTYTYGYSIAWGADYEKMREVLVETAERLGLDKDSLVITDDVPNEETQQNIAEKMGGSVPEGYFNPKRFTAQMNGLKIEVDQELTATVYFDPKVELPGYHFTYHASYEDMDRAADYLQNAYRDFIGMEHPQKNIFGGDYNIYGQQGYDVEFYDAGGDAVSQIINYNFYRVYFTGDTDGKLWLARRFQPDLSQKVGNYPIISAKEAGALLLNGNYITTVPYEIPGEDYIKKVELIYRKGQIEEYYMPYYRFYIELPEAARDMETELNIYGAYYVPAVESAYIANMPVWDGRFN